MSEPKPQTTNPWAASGEAAGIEGPLPAKSSAVAIRGGALRVLGYATGVLVSLGTASILVRHLGVKGFGKYVIVTSLVALVGSLTEAGIVVFGIREYVGRGASERARLMANLLGMRVALSLAGVACAVAFALAIGYGEALVLGTVIAGGGLIGQVVTDVLSVSLQAQLLLGRLTAVELVRRVLILAIVAVLALSGAGLLPLLAAVPAATALAMALMAWLVRAEVRIGLRFDWQAWRELLVETLPFAIALSLAGIYFYVTVIMMSLIASETQTGLFGTSFRVTQVALAVPSLLLTAIFPLLTRLEHTSDTDPGASVGKVFTVAAICGVWMSLAMALGADFIIHLIAGSKARGAIPVLRLQGLVFAVSFVSTAAALTLVTLRRYRPLVVASVAAVIIDIVLGLALIPPLGARGGALADVLTETAATVWLTATVIRSVRGHEISARVLGPLALACVPAAAFLLVPIGGAARALAGTLVYFGALLAMRAIPVEVLDAMRRLRAASRTA
jgi:O-antigen/teichoic acid export membrane protein